MPARQLMKYLDEQGVRYVTLLHSPAYTAQEIAATAHVPGKELAKTVVIKVDGKLATAVLPASYRVDVARLQQVTASDQVEIATEDEFADIYPGCETGAMPPFGNLYGLDVYVASELAEDEEIAFNAGTFSELVRMDYADFERLAQPKVAAFAARER